MSLSELVNRYLAVAGGYGKFMAISSLGLSRSEAERAFDILDEDYHISRFFTSATTVAKPTRSMDLHRLTSRSIPKYSRFSRSVLFRVARTQICRWYLTRWDSKKSDFKTPFTAH